MQRVHGSQRETSGVRVDVVSPHKSTFIQVVLIALPIHILMAAEKLKIEKTDYDGANEVEEYCSRYEWQDVKTSETPKYGSKSCELFHSHSRAENFLRNCADGTRGEGAEKEIIVRVLFTT